MQIQPVPKLIDIQKNSGKYLSDMVANLILFWNDHDSGVRRWTTVDSSSFKQAGTTFGPILDVRTGSTSTPTSSTGAYVDSTLTASLTPKSTASHVLVLIGQYVTINAPGVGTNICKLKLLRGSTSLIDTPVLTQNGATPALLEAMVPLVYWDAPASTSAQVYKTQIGNNGTPTSTIANNNPGAVSSTSWMILVEIGF